MNLGWVWVDTWFCIRYSFLKAKLYKLQRCTHRRWPHLFPSSFYFVSTLDQTGNKTGQQGSKCRNHTSSGS